MAELSFMAIEENSPHDANALIEALRRWHKCTKASGVADRFIEKLLGRLLTEEERDYLFAPCAGNCADCLALKGR